MSEPAGPDDVRDWECLESRAGPDLTLFRVRTDRMVNPRTGQAMDRLVLETPDWVNVVARTAAGDVILVRQYRFGSGGVTTEIPGGVVHPDEPSREAAERELREETGYTSSRWSYLGAVAPNPAFQDNLCHHWLAEAAERTHPLDPDPGEDLAVRALSADAVVRQVQAGEIQHALVISALGRVFDLHTPGARS